MLDSLSIQQSIFIVGDGSLFDEGVAELLTNSTSMRVIHAVYSDEIAFLNIIKRDQPDMILVCESGMLEIEQILDAVSTDPLMSGLRIFGIRLRNLVIDIYERPIRITGKLSYRSRSIIATSIDDLIDIVSGNIQ